MVRRGAVLSIGQAPVRSLTAYLPMEANPIAGVISGHISAVVPRAGVMRVVAELTEMDSDEVIDACFAALIKVRQGRQQTIRVGSFHATGLGCKPHLLQALIDAVSAAFGK